MTQAEAARRAQKDRRRKGRLSTSFNNVGNYQRPKLKPTLSGPPKPTPGP
jgi:hypothetical protein